MNQNNESPQPTTTVCYWPGRESGYSRNRVLLKAMATAGLTVYDCSCPHKHPVRYFLSFLKFIKYYRKCDFILVGFLGHFLIPIVRFFTKKPIAFDSFVSIYMTMCLDRKTFKSTGLFAALSKWVDNMACHYADRIICDTQEHIIFFSDTYKINREKFIRLWVGSDETVMAPKGNVLQQQNLIHFHGEFQQLHGIPIIIKAAQLLPQYHFRLIGKGQLRPQCEALVEELHLNNVTFIDPVPYKELAEKMEEATICLGIFGDTVKALTVIPHKVFEALAMGKPVITANTPAARELLTHGENACLCEPDPESLANTIKDLMGNKELREQIARNGKVTFYEKASFLSLGNKIRAISDCFLKKIANQTV